MGLITETVKVKWSRGRKAYYESLGYKYTKMGDEFLVKVKDLTKGSNVEVNGKCDGCGKDLVWSYNDYNHVVKEDGCTYCQVCGNNLARSGEAFSKSFYDWCIENKRQDILSRWDCELNNCSPKDITYGTNKKYWFKCDKHPEHESELKSINKLTNDKDKSICCIQCSSVAQYILDNFPNNDLYEIWDKDKNKEVNPWKIKCGNRSKKYWFICQEKDYHGSYEMTCDNFSRGQRCPYCGCKNGKVHPKDSIGQYIIDKYGEKFLHKIWSDKNNKAPFEDARTTKKKVWWRCPEGKHEDYLRACRDSFSYEFRCPKCVEEMNNSIIEEKTKTYLQELKYTVLTEHNCTLKPVNPKTKRQMPYDNEVECLKLVIEVHGIQHYSDKFYKTMLHITKEEAEKMLKQRKLYDRYKKAYAEHCGYEYLELPYWAFEGKNKDLYKQMIDDKIKEILNKEKAS